MGIWLKEQLLLCCNERSQPAADIRGSPLHQTFGCHSRILGRARFSGRKSKIKVVLKSVASHVCLTIAGRPRQQYLVSRPHLNDTNAIIRVKPHQNSLETAFSVRQCDYYVGIRVSYFYHISWKSGFQRTRGEVITSHLGKNPACRLLDRKIEGWLEPQGCYHNSRGVQAKNGKVWDKITATLKFAKPHRAVTES